MRISIRSQIDLLCEIWRFLIEHKAGLAWSNLFCCLSGWDIMTKVNVHVKGQQINAEHPKKFFLSL